FLRTKAVAVERYGNRITSVLTYGFDSRRWIAFRAAFVLDATDTGELLPLVSGPSGVDYVTGAEPRGVTGEPHAPEAADPLDIQTLTYTFVLGRDPAHDHRLAEPPQYAVHRREQAYGLTIDYGGGKTLTYHVFDKAAGTPGSFWAYRRLVSADNFHGPAAPREISMVNWPGNDYCGPDFLAGDPARQAEVLRQAKLASLGFAYWLQTEAPRDDAGAGTGYPELEFQTSQLGSADGLSQFPYVRESRRLKALETVREQDISAQYQKGPRAAPFSDSAGIGDYAIDIHGCSKQDLSLPTKPFQIPLGALIPFQIENLLAASKDIGTTHITSGAYRVHPVEWAIGEAAGALADFALEHNSTPARIQSDPMLTEQFQAALLERGAPVYWFDDLEPGDLVFQAAQLLAVRGIFEPSRSTLHFGPKQPLTRADAVRAVAQALDLMPPKPPGAAVPPVAVQTRIALQSLIDAGYLPPTFADENPMAGGLLWPDLSPVCEKTGVEPPLDQGTFHPATRAAFAVWLWDLRRRKAGAMR
ncbi:MAG TPA: FAD-dependent oxidoreductase, partial [Terriglobia bacterium]|nr:FAD-dependent oxidoreductase [Terriglobia bacterium]